MCYVCNVTFVMVQLTTEQRAFIVKTYFETHSFQEVKIMEDMWKDNEIMNPVILGIFLVARATTFIVVPYY